jgi:hypothetical protein
MASIITRAGGRRGLSGAALQMISEASVKPRAYRGMEVLPVKALASMDYEQVKVEAWKQRGKQFEETHGHGTNLLLKPFDPKTEACLRKALAPVARELNLKVGYDHKEKAIRISPVQPTWKDDKKNTKGWARSKNVPVDLDQLSDLESELNELDLSETAEAAAAREEEELIEQAVAELAAEEYSLQEGTGGGEENLDVDVVTVTKLYSSPYEAVSLKKLQQLQQNSNGKGRSLRELLHQIGTNQ